MRGKKGLAPVKSGPREMVNGVTGSICAGAGGRSLGGPGVGPGFCVPAGACAGALGAGFGGAIGAGCPCGWSCVCAKTGPAGPRAINAAKAAATMERQSFPLIRVPFPSIPTKAGKPQVRMYQVVRTFGSPKLFQLYLPVLVQSIRIPPCAGPYLPSLRLTGPKKRPQVYQCIPKLTTPIPATAAPAAVNFGFMP